MHKMANGKIAPYRGVRAQNMKTKSEKLFETFCDKSAISYERLQEGDEKTPDYFISFSQMKVVAEVKELERNSDEKESDRLINERGYGEWLSNEPGDRVRSKIRKASPQIKRLTIGKFPGILVLYDYGDAYGHLDPYNIRVAMNGLEQIHFALPRDLGESPHATGMSHGPKRKMTIQDNTSISAIAVMHTPDRDTIKLDIFHNKHATIPLDPVAVARCGIRQYFLADGSEVSTSAWLKYEP